MKITGDYNDPKPGSYLKIVDVKNNEKFNSNQERKKNDEFERNLKNYKKIIADYDYNPAPRKNKISSLKKSVKHGKYKINGLNVARKLIEIGLVNNVVWRF